MLNANLQIKQKASITVSPSLPVCNAIITDQPHYRFTESSITPPVENTSGFLWFVFPPPKATNYEAEQGATDNTTD